MGQGEEGEFGADAGQPPRTPSKSVSHMARKVICDRVQRLKGWEDGVWGDDQQGQSTLCSPIPRCARA